jgi:hypothetical protein
VQVAKRAAPIPQAYERLLYPDGALPLREAYEQLIESFGQTKNPDAFLDPFLRGDLVIKVFDPERNMVFALTPKQIEGYASEHGSADLLFMRECIGDLGDGPLADYVNLAPYVERCDFERLLGTSLSRSNERSRGQPLTIEAAIDATETPDAAAIKYSKRRPRTANPEDGASRTLQDNALLRELLAKWPDEKTRPADREMARQLATGTRKEETIRKRIAKWRELGKLGSVTHQR